MVDPEQMKLAAQVASAVAILAVGAVAFVKANKNAGKFRKCQDLLGAYPRSPRPITVQMDRATAKRKFIQGLNQVQVNQSWSVKNADFNSSTLAASMRWSGTVAVNVGFGNSPRDRKLVQVNSTLTLKGDAVPQGGQTILQWTYDPDSTEWSAPSMHHTDPAAEDYCIETNYQILKALGLIE